MKLVFILCALWFALMSGFFFAFSSTVMPGLALLQDAQGIDAMQAINRAVSNPFFAAGFWVALALASIGAGVAVVRRAPGWMFLLAGCLIYIAGAFITTGAGNVPLNRALEAVSPGSAEALAAWERFQLQWTSLNNLRMAAGFVAAAVVLFPFLKDSK